MLDTRISASVLGGSIRSAGTSFALITGTAVATGHGA
jgi:hypothetical protein